MSDFDDWVKKQTEASGGSLRIPISSSNAPAKPAAPQPDAPRPTGGDFDAWMQGGTKPSQPTPAITPDSTVGPLYESLQDMSRRGREQRQAEQARRQAEFERLPMTE